MEHVFPNISYSSTNRFYHENLSTWLMTQHLKCFVLHSQLKFKPCKSASAYSQCDRSKKEAMLLRNQLKTGNASLHRKIHTQPPSIALGAYNDFEWPNASSGTGRVDLPSKVDPITRIPGWNIYKDIYFWPGIRVMESILEGKHYSFVDFVPCEPPQ